MRVAFVQGGPGLEPVQAQVDRLRRLSPDRYQIEEHRTGPAHQRMVELLDGLRSGDELCLTSLEPFRLDVGEVAQALLDLADRGLRILLVDEDGAKLEIGKSPQSRRLLAAMAGLNRRRKALPAPKVRGGGQDLLSETEVADIRRLNQAGLSLRRIGLIYRRSPKCIADLLWSDETVAETPLAQRHA